MKELKKTIQMLEDSMDLVSLRSIKIMVEEACRRVASTCSILEEISEGGSTIYASTPAYVDAMHKEPPRGGSTPAHGDKRGVS